MTEGYSWGQNSRGLRRQGANPQPMGRVFAGPRQAESSVILCSLQILQGPVPSPCVLQIQLPFSAAHTHPAASKLTRAPSCLLCLTHSISTLPTPSIWPPDGSLGLFLTEPRPVGTEPQTGPPLSQARPWAAEEAEAGRAPTMCQTRSQTPALCSVFP